MISNNSDKNDAIEERDRVINMLDLSTKNRIQHDPNDYECACEDCLDEQVNRLDEMLIRKKAQDAVQEDRERILHGLLWSKTQDLCGIIDDPSKCMRVIELLENLIKGEQE